MKILFTLFWLILPFAAIAQELPSTYPSHYFSFTKTDSVTYPPLYPDQAVRDSIYASHTNMHRGVLAIEQYALEEQQIDFLHRKEENDNKWTLTLTNGEEITVGPSPYADVVDYTFEYYYPALELIVFRVQWGEGNDYAIVYRKTGEEISAYGPPHFSSDDHFFISYNGNDFTSYNTNGIQLFEMTEEGPQMLIEYDTDLAPSRVKWVDGTHFLLEVFDAELISNEGMTRNYQHYMGTISLSKAQ